MAKPSKSLNKGNTSKSNPLKSKFQPRELARKNIKPKTGLQAKPRNKIATKPVIEKKEETPTIEKTPDKKPKEEHFENIPQPKNYQTNLDKLYDLIEKEGKISLKETSKKLNLPITQVEEWTKVLNKQEMINIHYPLIGSIILTRKGFFEKKKDETIKKKPKKKLKIILIILTVLIFISLLLFIILIKGGYLVIE